VLPKGLGELSYATLNAEVIDWRRFHNRGQAGSFIGCCPSERSSGARQKLGEIDRMGNARLRTTLVEAVWRLRKHNAQWRGFMKVARGPGTRGQGFRSQEAQSRGGLCEAADDRPVAPARGHRDSRRPWPQTRRMNSN
jgi:hypothetical protein